MRRRDLLARYFATLSQIIFGAVVLKQFTERLNVVELIVGLIGAARLVILAYFIQPED